MGAGRSSSPEFVTQIDDRLSIATSARDAGAQLTVLSGIQIGRVFHLLAREVTLGRGPEATIRLNHSSVSRLHAAIRALPGGDYEIEDLRSRNGTLVGGQPFDGHFCETAQQSEKWLNSAVEVSRSFVSRTLSTDH